VRENIDAVPFAKRARIDSLARAQSKHHGFARARVAGQILGIPWDRFAGQRRRLVFGAVARVRRADAVEIRRRTHPEAEVLAVAPVVGVVLAAKAGPREIADLVVLEAGRGQFADRQRVQLRFAVVAGEVKALSGQTGKVTEEIRKRLGTFASEMAQIESAVVDSHKAVGDGSGIVNQVVERVISTGDAMVDVAQRARHLADLLENQRAATSEIAESTVRIAAKIGKTETEIGAINTRLVGCEKLAQGSWDEDTSGYPGADIARLPAEAAIVKRHLAAMLIGAESPMNLPSALDRERLAACLDRYPVLRQREGALVSRLERAARKAQEQARLLVASLETKSWAAASEAYETCEKALADVADAVRLILGKLKDGSSEAA